MNRYRADVELVRESLIETEGKDRVRNMQPPVTGEEIMEIFNLPPSREVGELKAALKDAILDGIIANDRDEALNYLMMVANEKGFKPQNTDSEQKDTNE